MPMRKTVSASAIRGRLAPAATASAIANAAFRRFPVLSLDIAANPLDFFDDCFLSNVMQRLCH
jgi:hypothetical protein